MMDQALAAMPLLKLLNFDGRLLFGTRIVRLFAYGFLSVVLALYLVQVGLTETEIGTLLTLTLIGDAGISLWITTTADRLGRRRMLVLGALLMLGAGVVFAFTSNLILLALAAVVAALVVAFLAGRFSKPVEVREVVKVETKTETIYAAHSTTTATDKGRVRIVTVVKREPTGAVQTTRTEERAADLTLHSDWTGTESNRASEKAEATTVTRSSIPGWSVGGSALWATRDLSPKPQVYTLEIDRRLFGSLWVGVRVNTDRQVGAGARLEW